MKILISQGLDGVFTIGLKYYRKNKETKVLLIKNHLGVTKSETMM